MTRARDVIDKIRRVRYGIGIPFDDVDEDIKMYVASLSEGYDCASKYVSC